MVAKGKAQNDKNGEKVIIYAEMRLEAEHFLESGVYCAHLAEQPAPAAHCRYRIQAKRGSVAKCPHSSFQSLPTRLAASGRKIIAVNTLAPKRPCYEQSLAE